MGDICTRVVGWLAIDGHRPRILRGTRPMSRTLPSACCTRL